MTLCYTCLKPYDDCNCSNKDYGATTYDYSPNEQAGLVIDGRITQDYIDSLKPTQP
jgi:hypothetical protein